MEKIIKIYSYELVFQNGSTLLFYFYLLCPYWLLNYIYYERNGRTESRSHFMEIEFFFFKVRSWKANEVDGFFL